MWGLHSFIRKGEEKKMIPLAFVLVSQKTARKYKAILHTLFNGILKGIIFYSSIANITT